MGAITGASEIAAGVNFVSLSSWSLNSAATGSSSSNMCRYKFSYHVPGGFRYSQPSYRRRWLSSSHKMKATIFNISWSKCVRQKVPDESSGEAVTKRAMKFQRSQRVLAVVLSTLLCGTPALAGVETTLETKLSGLVDTSSDKVSSVEAILAKQLARRFREMSDEELILVLQELLKASRSVSPQDAVLDAKGPREENRKPVDVKPDAQSSSPQTKPGGEGRNGVELKEGEAKGQEISAARPNSNSLASKKNEFLLPETGRAPILSKESTSQEIITKEDTSSSSDAREGREGDGKPPGRSDNVGEIENEDMTGVLWDEWRRRVKDQGVLEPASSEQGFSIVSGVTDVWEKVESFSNMAMNEASNFSGWIGDNREAVGGGLLASGIIVFVLYVRKKFLPLRTGNTSEGDKTKDDQPATKSQLSPSDKGSLREERGNLLQASQRTFAAEKNKVLDSKQGPAQVVETASTTTAPSNENTTAEVKDKKSGPLIRSLGDDMLIEREKIGKKRTDVTTQDSSSRRGSFPVPSKQVLYSPTESLDDRRGGKEKKTGKETGVDGFYPPQTSYLRWRRNNSEKNSAGEKNRVNLLASRAATAFRAEGLSRLEAEERSSRTPNSKANHNGVKKFESKGNGQSSPELDSFVHNQDFWVRDSDGVFIKHTIESQGKLLREKEVRRADQNNKVHTGSYSKGAFTRLAEGWNGAAKEQRHKQSNSSSEFDYRQLYLTPKENDSTPNEKPESKTAGNNSLTTLSGATDSGKIGPIRYGVERTR
ncbi:hypothetical protein R1flu_011125 [Riccia fluitans]|uniref:Uncharacterized protein n=1 Tax=Riccia fluitans TaxID=41844 RepID=A0ABD1Z735_9MARC